MRLAAVRPHMEGIKAELLENARAGNQEGMSKAQAGMQKLHQEHDIQPWKGLLPMVQAPIAFGFFRVIKGMTALPVPGLEKESVAWIDDVTVHDPFFILPFTTSALLYLSLKVRFPPPPIFVLVIC